MADEAKVTIRDIAHHAQVSISTVSRVITGNAMVSSAKRKAVVQAMEDLDYRPNLFARGLASGQSMTVGVLTHNFGSPFYDTILQGILNAITPTQYSPIFADGRWETEIENQALQTLLDRQVDGLILIGGMLDANRLKEIASQLPLIIAARTVDELADNCISINNRQAAFEATQHLINLGHRDIAHITASAPYSQAVFDINHRYDGYVQAMEAANLPIDPDLVIEGNLQRQSGLIAVETLLMRGRPFSAIFAANDQMAFGARLGLHRHGIRVPEDVSLIGFDDESPAAYMLPPMTTVHQPGRALGLAAVEAVMDLIQGKPIEQQILSCNLVHRESVMRRR